MKDDVKYRIRVTIIATFYCELNFWDVYRLEFLAVYWLEFCSRGEFVLETFPTMMCFSAFGRATCLFLLIVGNAK